MRSEFCNWFEKRHGKNPHHFTEDYADYTYLKHETGKAWQHQQSKVDELQKRVDELATAFNQLIEMESESISTELDQFDKGWNQSARQTIENIFKLTGLGEQALKGGSDE